MAAFYFYRKVIVTYNKQTFFILWDVEFSVFMSWQTVFLSSHDKIDQMIRTQKVIIDISLLIRTWMIDWLIEWEWENMIGCIDKPLFTGLISMVPTGNYVLFDWSQELAVTVVANSVVFTCILSWAPRSLEGRFWLVCMACNMHVVQDISTA